ncbi:MAG TPA: hypothetical protein VMV94_11360 [Phycisphaerae bacterium]|nr:hypothetical protein [Phycisphaerae bacterium]
MRPTILIAATLTLLALNSALATPTATLTLESPQAGQAVQPGAMINWTIKLGVSLGDNAGLALIACDLVQDAANPGFFDIPPADSGSVDATMQNFTRPLGIANPGEGGATCGFIGVQRGPAGQKNLIQIGGTQNTFGAVGPAGIGQDDIVNPAVGQSVQPQIVVSGSFPAPGTPGSYSFHLENGLANVLNQADPPPAPPAYWPVSHAVVAGLPAAAFTFTVQSTLGDLNCDGAVNTSDIPHFVQALLDPAGYNADHDGSPYPPCAQSRADLNGDTRTDGLDIRLFVDLLL